MNVLSNEEIQQALTELPEWKQVDDKIERTYDLESFPKAVGFVNAVAVYADSKDHHPDIFVHGKEVTLTLTTWSEKAITDLDIEVAKHFDFLKED